MGMVWGEYLVTGIALVDEQHKELFDRINTFLDACDRGVANEKLIGLLQFLDDYVQFHFQAEEQLQEANDYYDRPRHREAHRWFCTQLSEFKRRFLLEGASEELKKEINLLLVGWLLAHIAEKDREFGQTIIGEKN